MSCFMNLIIRGEESSIKQSDFINEFLTMNIEHASLKYINQNNIYKLTQIRYNMKLVHKVYKFI